MRCHIFPKCDFLARLALVNPFSNRQGFCEFALQTLFCMPQIARLLHPQPKFWPIADEFPYSECHFCGQGMRASQNAMQCST